jgi:hypothetical protein
MNGFLDLSREIKPGPFAAVQPRQSSDRIVALFAAGIIGLGSHNDTIYAWNRNRELRLRGSKFDHHSSRTIFNVIVDSDLMRANLRGLQSVW